MTVLPKVTIHIDDRGFGTLFIDERSVPGVVSCTIKQDVGSFVDVTFTIRSNDVTFRHGEVYGAAATELKEE